MTFRNSRAFFLAGAFGAALIPTSPAWAQTASASADADGVLASADIIVTASKRETRLQETPASITALSGNLLQSASITGVNDLAKAVPGLTVNDGGAGQRRITLRGVRSAGEAQVGIYYDEAPVASPPGTTSDAGGNQSDFNLFDVDRVEVLRGPQGTLYGASSMGGTLRVIYRKPDFRFGGSAEVSANSVAHGGLGYNLNAELNVPIVNDLLAVRGVYYHRYQDGWIDNPTLHLTDLNTERTDGGRLIARLTPAPWFTLDAAAYFQDSKARPATWMPSAGRYTSSNRAQLLFYDKSQLYTVTGTAKLGFADLIATGTYQNRDAVIIRDPNFLLSTSYNNVTSCRRHFTAAVCATSQGMTDFNNYVSSVTPLSYYAPQNTKNWTGEIRLQSYTSQWIGWTAGFYYANRKSLIDSRGMLVDGQGAPIDSAPLVFDRHIDDRLRQIAGFGEVSLKPLPGLTVTGGLRYYDYRRTVAGDTTKGFDLINFAIQPWTVRENSEKGWLYKANISWQATPTILLYAQAASGFRPGGANQVLGLPQSFTPYQADSLWTYEAGAKTTALSGAILLNLTGFITDWKNMQVSGTSGTFAFLTNAGSARVKGLEAEAAVAPLAGLQFSVNATALDARLTEDQVNGLVSAPGRKGDRIPNIPKFSFTFAGQYERQIANGLKALIRADLNHVGASYADFRPTAITYRKVGDYDLVNARIGVSADRWGAYLFVNNLFDTIARTNAANVLGGTLETVTTAPPRTIGIDLTTKF